MLPTVRRTQNWLPMLFNDFFDYDGFGKISPAMTPAINVIESEKEYKVELAAPGMSKEDFRIKLDQDNRLIIFMEKKEESSNGEKGTEKYLRREFSYSRFQQTLLLPDDIIKEKIEANMENGVLRVNIPKNMQEETMPKELTIEIR